MKQQHLIIGGVIAAIAILTGLGVLTYGFSQGGSLPGLEQPPTAPDDSLDGPQVTVTPPASLAELAAEIRPDYPELADLLENPELGSVYKDFYLVYQQGGREAAVALAHQRGILNEADQIVMTLVLDTEETAPLIAELEAEGVLIEAQFRHKINILIPLSQVQAQIEAEEPALIVERISNLNHVIRLELPPKATTKQRLIQGQGVNVTSAATWHEQGITGRGVKVGVLDLGFGGYRDLLGNELPDEVEVGQFGDRSTFATEVHGTACAEIVHEMAPEAEIVLAYYDGSDAAMGEAVQWLIEQEVDIISNSTGSNGLTPLDGSGFVAEIVDQAHDHNIFWVNAAGNEADAHYRGHFADADGDNLHDFAAGVSTIPFIPLDYDIEGQIILSWDDWQQVNQDYELILYDSNGTVLAKSEETQDGSEGQYPIESIFYVFDDPDVYYLSIENYEGQADGQATFDIFVYGASLDPSYVVPAYSLTNPADARGAFAVGAVNWADDVLEFYSSNGPTADGRTKPDLAAPSVVDSASYAPEAFDGTSAAAPHVAGAAALIRQAFPDFRPDDIATFLQERAIDLGAPGSDNAFGAGRLNLGESPAEPTVPDSVPQPEADIQATSTPRTSAPVGLPGQSVGIGAESGGGSGQADDSGGAIVFVGLCLLCFGGLAASGLIIAGFVVMRRR